MLVTKKITKPSDPYDVAGWNSFYESNPGFHRSVGADGDNGGEGGGEGGAAPAMQDTPEFKAALADAVRAGVQAGLDKEVTGLKNKNTDLIAAERKASLRAEAFGDLDPAAVKAMMDTLGQSEEAQMIADGKIDEVIAKRTDKIKSKAEDDIRSLTDQLSESETSRNGYKQKYERKTIDDAVREVAIKQGVLPHAMDDVIRRAGDVFSISDDGSLEARARDGSLLKGEDQMLINPDRFVQGLKSTSPHYWPASQGAGARGSDAATGDYDDNMQKLNDLASSGDMVGYRALRDKMTGGKHRAR